jgi:O-antigen/teichoic acid export membrane protein
MSSLIRKIVKGTGSFLSARLIERGLGFLFTIIASRYLGVEAFGVFAYGISIMAVTQKVAEFGLPTTVQRFLSGSKTEEKNQLYGAILMLTIATPTVGSLSLYVSTPLVAAHFGTNEIAPTLQVLSAALVPAIGFTIVKAVLQAQTQLRGIVISDSAKSILRVCALLVFVTYVPSAESAAWAVFVAFVCGTILATYFLQDQQLTPNLKNLTRHTKTVLTYSAPLVIVGLGYSMAQKADRLMIGWLLDAASVGTYTVASKLSIAVTIINGSASSIFKPLASEAYMHKKINQIQRAYSLIAKGVGLVTGIILLLFVVTGHWILAIFGVDFATEKTHILLIILTGHYFLGGVSGPTGSLLQVSDQHYLELRNALLFVVLNVGLNYILITNYGVLGAACATFLSGTILVTVQLVEIKYIYDINVITKPTILIFIVIVSSATLCIWLSSMVFKVITAIVAVIILGVVAFKTASDEEKRIVADNVHYIKY